MCESCLRRMAWFAMQYNAEGLQFEQNSKCIVVRSRCHLAVRAMQRRILPASAANQVSPVFEITGYLNFVQDLLYGIPRLHKRNPYASSTSS
jgi:hypothetical protein